jgi:Flp pilus assembly protein TadB
VPNGREGSDDGLNEREKDRLKDVINDINEDVKRPPYNISDNKKGYSREYKEFKEEEKESQKLTQYERMCYRMASLFSLSADEGTKEKLNPSIRLLDWEITPGMVMSATVGVGFFSFLAWFVVFMLNLLVITIIPVSLVAIAVLAPIGATVYTYYYPIFAAQNKVIRSSGEMILSILYMVIYMRTSANLEGALRFAALNLKGPISEDLKGVLWDVESGKYNQIDESLENYTKKWKNFNQDYLESLNLLRASLNEPSKERRDRLMQDAIDNILDGTKEKMKHYAQNLETPVMIINAVGAMLPVLGMIMLPLISAFMGGVITPLHLLIMFNIMLPTFLWIFMQRTLSSRPPTVSSKPSKEGNLPQRGKFEFEIMDRELAVPTWPVGAAVFLIVGFYGIIGYLIYPHFYPVENVNPAVIPAIFLENGRLDPFPMLLRSLSITLGLGLGIGTSKLLGNRARAAAEEDIKEIEQQFPNALFELGNKISGGTPIELALEDAAESTKDLKISNLFLEASENIKNMGMTFEDAIFDENYGALQHYPSQTIETVMRAILSSSEKGTQMASTAMMTISRYLENIHDTQEALNDLMEDTTTTIQMLAYMLAPVISGVAVSMSQTIISALYSLGESFSSTQQNLPSGGGGAGIGGAGILQNLKSAIPPELLQFVVGFYLLQLLYILGTFYTKITQGEDKTYKNMFIGKIMISGLFFYSMTVVIISLMFGGIVGSVGASLGG